MTGQEVLLDLLGYVGIKTFKKSNSAIALNKPNVSDDDIRRGLTAINAALQEIRLRGPVEFNQDRRSEPLYAPTPVTLTVTNPTTIVMTAGKQDWMVGCSIKIDGDPYQNEIVGFSGSNVSLLRAHPGAPAAGVSAVVYCDAVLLESDVAAVLEPVEMPPNRRLNAAQSRADFDRFTYQANDQATPATSITKSVGTPTLYFVEPFYSLVDNYLPLYIRVNPMPGSLTSLIFRVERKPERVDGDIYGNDDTDPGYEFTTVPADLVETLLLPVARWHFLSHPNLKNKETRAAIIDAYKLAMDSITVGASNFNVSRKRTRAKYR